MIATATAAEKVVIYRCTDGKGAVTFQNNVPCPKGSKQERKVMETPPPKARAVAPAPAAPAADAAPVAEADSAPMAEPAQALASVAQEAPVAPPPLPYGAVVEGGQLPPPVLYECRTYNDDSYLSEIGTPQQRCVTLTTTGLGGIPAAGAGDACEMKTDECARVPDGALCDRWRQRLREAESAVRFGAAEDAGFAEAEVQRIGRIVRESVCGQ
ncbi:MAG TPA: DUF4124 domain-containing protein [Lysobacter sp.]|nr:DUF4124 domain-containing protein [Lysobacter sp.]